MAIRTPSSDAEQIDPIIQRILEMARSHVGMEFAFLGNFSGAQEVFTEVQGPAGYLEAGSSIPLEGSYCGRMVDGRISNLIPDAASDPQLNALEVTDRVGIGSYIGVPVTLSDGSVYGALCCISHAAEPDLTDHDSRFMGLLAELVAKAIEHQRLAGADAEALHLEIAEVLEQRQFQVLFQPMVNAGSGRVVGLEALARFSPRPTRSPDLWFAQAWRAGLGETLELAAARLALDHLPEMDPDLHLSINLSARTLVSPGLEALIAGVPPHRLQIEVTEHEAVEDYGRLRSVRDQLSERGIRFAIDDAGAGFAGLKHIVRLAPDVIKLDMFMTRDIDVDPVKRAMAAALVTFAAETGATLVAEGVETPAELTLLRGLGVRYVQGYLTGRPIPLDTVPTWVDLPRRTSSPGPANRPDRPAAALPTANSAAPPTAATGPQIRGRNPNRAAPWPSVAVVTSDQTLH